MISAFPSFICRGFCLALPCLLLASCAGLQGMLRRPSADAVVYALGPRDAFTSPLNGSLQPACSALQFDEHGFDVTASHEQRLRDVAAETAPNKKATLLIAGYAPPSLPQDHARALSERRALAVRQRLIEMGVEAANLQTVGYGNDFSPSGPSSGVVVVYRQN